MKRTRNFTHRSRQGSVLVLTLVMIMVLAVLAVAIAGMSGANVQIADNFRKLDITRASAESGLEVMRYWISKVAMSGNLAPSDRFSTLASKLQDALTAAEITNLTPVCGASTISISSVPLNSSSGQNFSAVLTKIDDDNVRLDVTGLYGSLSRTIQTNYRFGKRAHTVFDFGVASKGPLYLSGNIEMEGANIDVESNAYIETNAWLALTIKGNSHIAGEVKITSSYASVDIQGGQAGIGGETGYEDSMKHIEKGVAPTEFPEMHPELFYGYATNVLSPTADLSANATYENLRIPADRNPSFTGNVTLQGVILIEAPNVVSFAGGVDITGIIVTDGCVTDNSGTNQITFTGHVTSHPIDQLQQPQFEGLQSQTGTFMLAPGFQASFGGSFGTLSGAIAANGIKFYGNAGGTINGSIVNYSDGMMELSGNSDLYFNRSGRTKVPAGFVPEIILHYDPSSYAETVL